MLPSSFEASSPEEQRWQVSDTWCDHCQAADLGITEPRIERQGDAVFVVGACKRCGHRCSTQVMEQHAPGE